MRVASASRLEVDPATRPGFVMLTDDWRILLDDGRWIVVKAGFWCDGASIPAIVRPVLSPLVLLAMGVAHDYAVRRGAILWREGGLTDAFDPAAATSLAVALAERAGVGRFLRWAISAALRLAAPTYWQQRGMEWAP